MEESQTKVLDERLESLIKPSKEQKVMIKTEESLTLEEVLDKQLVLLVKQSKEQKELDNLLKINQAIIETARIIILADRQSRFYAEPWTFPHP